jgi:hypothetical protein
MNGTVPLKIKHHSLTGRITLELMYEAFRSALHRGTRTEFQSRENEDCKVEGGLCLPGFYDHSSCSQDPAPILGEIQRSDSRTDHP